MSKFGRGITTLIFLLLIFGSPHNLSAQTNRHSCFYDRVYCKARTDRISMIRGPTVKIKDCELGVAIDEAMARLRNVCGSSCLAPMSCMALDDMDFEVEVSYTPR